MFGARRLSGPLTEQIVARLPGRRPLWVVMWALVPWLNAGGNLLLAPEARSAIWDQRRAVVVLSYAALSLAVVIALWGASRIARRVEDIERAIIALLERRPRGPFRELTGAAGPLAASAATALAFGVSSYVDDGWVPALLRGATWLALGVALWSFVWAYATLQLGLARIGGERLRADVVHLDPGLGVRPLGGAAFTGLWMLLACLVPVVLTGVSDLVGVAIGVVVLGAALAAFLASLLRLHRQMVKAKASELAIARDLYEQAYEPVRATPTLETLERQQRLLSAADALDKRARAIHEWPIDEGTLARVITIASSVVAVIVARLILDPFGL